jgi:hypothetical protein
MSIASKIVVDTYGASAVTYYGGYAVFLDKPRVLFPTGVLLREKRNSEGRCTSAKYEYADGSKLLFTWGPVKGNDVKEVLV